MEITEEDLRFLAAIDIAGMYPVMYPHQGMAQWDMAGLNFQDKCFQAIIQEQEGEKRLILQVLRRRTQGGSGGEYEWMPLENMAFFPSRDTKEKLIRKFKRWAGMSAERSPELEPFPMHESFRVWLEAVEGQGIRDLASDFFGSRDWLQSLKRSEIYSFLSLPALRDLVQTTQISAVKDILEELEPPESDQQTLGWLISALGGRVE